MKSKTIFIRDYKGERVPVTLSNFENIKELQIAIVSGDEIVTVVYNDGTEKTYDSSNCRWKDFFDDAYIVPLKHISTFSSFKGSSYDCADMIRELD